MTTLLYRAFAAALEVRSDGDGRTITGVAVPYGQPARIGHQTTETFVRGAFAGADPAEVPFTAAHPADGAELPIGITRTLDDQPDGLHGEWYISDTALGNDVLTLIRDGAVRGLSIGFLPVPGGDHWNAQHTHVERRAAVLDHVAVVRVAAYQGAAIAALRTAHAPATPRLRLARLLRC